MIGQGLLVASHGDTITVAEGIYLENIHFQGKNVVLRSTDPLNPSVVGKTIIDGNKAGCVVTFEGSEKETCVLSGFTIMNGGADEGGGIHGFGGTGNAHATIENNRIIKNSATSSGGGLYACSGPIDNNLISENSAGSDGGGLHSCHGPIRRNTITGNSSAVAGGGLHGCNGTIEDNLITDNIAHGGGGGLCFCDALINHNTIADNSSEQNGGGLSGCGGTIQNNTVSGNSAGDNGGGLYGCEGEVRQNTITGNQADGHGGGACVCSGFLNNNVVRGNSATCGGGFALCQNTIQDNSITGNTAHEEGGGLHRCDGLVQHNNVEENSAHLGGGLYLCNGTIQNNVVVQNAADYGGGLRACGGFIRNNVIAGNSAVTGAGLQWCQGSIHNNTIVSNSADDRGGGIAHCANATIRNCILWANTATLSGNQIYQSSDPTFCCIQEWDGGGEGNKQQYPHFRDADGADDDPETYDDNDYRLWQESACVDAGMNEEWMWEAVDLDCHPRVFLGISSLTVDMGAFEYGYFPFRIVEIIRGCGTLIRWNSRPGDRYDVWSRDDLVDGMWVWEATVGASGAIASWNDTDETSPRKFYRVELVHGGALPGG
jgi:hypothetical protein